MKELTIDFEKCPGPDYCNACGNVYTECKKNGHIKYKKYGWAEAQMVTKLIDRCPHNAIVVTG